MSVFSFWLCCTLMCATFSCLSLTDLGHLMRVQLRFWWRPSTACGLPYFPCSCSYSHHFIFLQGLMWQHHMSEISHFRHFGHGSNEWLGLTFWKISLFSFLSTILLEFSALPIVQKHQVFFYPPSKVKELVRQKYQREPWTINENLTMMAGWRQRHFKEAWC